MIKAVEIITSKFVMDKDKIIYPSVKQWKLQKQDIKQYQLITQKKLLIIFKFVVFWIKNVHIHNSL